MRIAELVGMVGAGKTTLAEGLRIRLQDDGWVVLSLDEALRASARRVRGMGSLLRFAWSLRVLRAGVTFWFAATHLRFTARAVRSQLGLPISLGHRATILRLVFKVRAQCWFAQSRLQGREVVVVDEGPMHRAVNLFAWAPQLDSAAVAEYLESLTTDTVVILVSVPPKVAHTRAAERGFPKRLDATDETAVADFLGSAANVIGEVEVFLENSTRSSLTVDNDRPLEVVIDELAPKVEALLETSPDLELLGNAWQRLGVPRPGRGARPDAGSAAPADLTTAIETAYGLQAIGGLRYADRAGRSDTGVLDTERGPKFVKVYKESVSTDAIRREHAVLDHLAAKSFPAPRLVRTAEGRSYESALGRLVAVFELIEGRFHYHDYLWPFMPAQAFVGLSARTLARLHAALRDFTPDFDNADGFAGVTEPRIRGTRWARTIIDGSSSHVVERLAVLEERLGGGELTRGTIHGDFGPYNLLFGWDDQVAVVDFELARFDWLITDIAKALPQFGSNRFGFNFDRMASFASEYAAASEIDPAELKLLPDVWEFLTLRRAVVCWERSAHGESGRWVDEANAKLELASMISRRADTLASLLWRL